MPRPTAGPSRELSMFVWDPFSRWFASFANRYITSWIPPPPRQDHDPPRKVLMIHAHPAGTACFNGQCFLRAQTALEAAGHEVRAISLYQDDFRPAISMREAKEYLKPFDQRTGDVDDIKPYVDLLRWCDSLVFVYPTWWYGLPGILKGWIDRCFLPSIAFDLPKSPSDKVTSVGLVAQLHNITKIGVVSTYGSNMKVMRWVGDAGRRTIARGLRPLMSSQCTLQWMGMYGADTADEHKRKEFLERVSAAFHDF